MSSAVFAQKKGSFLNASKCRHIWSTSCARKSIDLPLKFETIATWEEWLLKACSECGNARFRMTPPLSAFIKTETLYLLNAEIIFQFSFRVYFLFDSGWKWELFGSWAPSDGESNFSPFLLNQIVDKIGRTFFLFKDCKYVYINFV